MTGVPEDNPFASPVGLDEVEIEAQVVPDPQTSKKRPPTPDSILLAWMMGLVLCPVQIICLGFVGIFLVIPLVGMLAYLPTRSKWVWSAAIVFFLIEAVVLGLAALGTLSIGMLPIAGILVISVLLCLAIIGCLCQRSARDHYHRNEA